MGEREVVIEGWEVENLAEWGRRLRVMNNAKEEVLEGVDEARESGSSSPLSEISGSAVDSGFG